MVLSTQLRRMFVSVTIHRTDLLDTGGSGAAGWAIIGLCLASSLVIIALSAPDRGAEYCDEHVCLCVCVCLSVRIHILGTTCPIFIFFVHVTCGCGSVLL